MSAIIPMGDAVTPLLREAWPRHTAKMAAQAANVPLETARCWAKGRSTPSASTLLRMADACDAFADALERRLADRRAARAAGQAGATAGQAAPPNGVKP